MDNLMYKEDLVISKQFEHFLYKNGLVVLFLLFHLEKHL